MKLSLQILILSAVLFIINCNIIHKDTKTNKNHITVGVFSDNGASSVCIIETLEALKIDSEIEGVKITSAQIMNEKLDSIDVLIFPGGSGSKELNSLGDMGIQKIIDFVKVQGKGIVGICAGGYILSTTPTYPSLKLIDAYNVDRKHYTRGRGLVELQITEQGLKIFPELKNRKTFLQYYDGPVLAPTDSNSVKYTELAKFVTDIHGNPGIPKGVTPGKTFMLFEKIGKGNIFTIAGHPESTPGMRWIVPRMARYVYSQEIISYNPKWILPEINDSSIIFTPDLKKYEKKLFWQLFNDTVQIQIQAMDKLHDLRSRPAVRWTIGLLRDNSPKVREHAALILKQTEYTFALPDLIMAEKNEKNKETKKQMKETIDFLSNF